MNGMMKISAGAILISALLLLISACSGEVSFSQIEPSHDIAEMLALEGQAKALAEELAADAVLKQVDRGRDMVGYIFHYTDTAATRVITVSVPVDEVPSGEWEVRTGISPLIGHQSPGLFLGSLRVGPDAVVKAATEHWKACPVRGLSLTGEEDQLTWLIFCNLPEGVVSASMDGTTGEFVPSQAPPAQPPPTATPDCQLYKSAQGCQSFFGHRDGLVDVGVGVGQ